jgi:hypothetical protein
LSRPTPGTPSVSSLHLASVVQMVNSPERTAALRSQLLLVGRLGQLTLVAYLKLLRVVVAERLWVIEDRPTQQEVNR